MTGIEVGIILIGGGAFLISSATSTYLVKRREDRKKEAKFFGKPLDQFKLKRLGDTGIPIIFERWLHRIETEGVDSEGIFRISCSHDVLMDLNKQINERGGRRINFDEQPITVISALIKFFLRELPDCLLLSKHYNDFLQIEKTEDDMEKWREKIQSVIDKLPDRNVLLLKQLLLVLSKVAANSDVNKMTADNLAVVFGPCLIFSLEAKEALSLFSDSSTITSLVSKLIDIQAQLKLDRNFQGLDPKKKKKRQMKEEQDLKKSQKKGERDSKKEQKKQDKLIKRQRSSTSGSGDNSTNSLPQLQVQEEGEKKKGLLSSFKVFKRGNNTAPNSPTSSAQLMVTSPRDWPGLASSNSTATLTTETTPRSQLSTSNQDEVESSVSEASLDQDSSDDESGNSKKEALPEEVPLPPSPREEEVEESNKPLREKENGPLEEDGEEERERLSFPIPKRLVSPRSGPPTPRIEITNPSGKQESDDEDDECDGYLEYAPLPAAASEEHTESANEGHGQVQDAEKQTESLPNPDPNQSENRTLSSQLSETSVNQPQQSLEKELLQPQPQLDKESPSFSEREKTVEENNNNQPPESEHQPHAEVVLPLNCSDVTSQQLTQEVPQPKDQETQQHNQPLQPEPEPEPEPEPISVGVSDPVPSKEAEQQPLQDAGAKPDVPLDSTNNKETVVDNLILGEGEGKEATQENFHQNDKSTHQVDSNAN